MPNKSWVQAAKYIAVQNRALRNVGPFKANWRRHCFQRTKFDATAFSEITASGAQAILYLALRGAWATQACEARRPPQAAYHAPYA